MARKAARAPRSVYASGSVLGEEPSLIRQTLAWEPSEGDYAAGYCVKFTRDQRANLT